MRPLSQNSFESVHSVVQTPAAHHACVFGNDAPRGLLFQHNVLTYNALVSVSAITYNTLISELANVIAYNNTTHRAGARAHSTVRTEGSRGQPPSVPRPWQR